MAYVLQHKFSSFFVIVILLVIGVVSVGLYFTSAPRYFPLETLYQVPQGATLASVARDLEDQNYIKHANIFKLLAYATGNETSILAGTYYFNEPVNAFQLLEDLTVGEFNVPTERVTIFEGEAAFQFAPRIADVLDEFNEAEFLALVSRDSLEGFLFPDTYLFPINADAAQVISIMQRNFERRTADLQNQIEASPLGIEEIIIKASLIEKEAGVASYETKRMVAGIINNRLEIDMLLQIDAVFSFIFQTHLPRTLFRHLEVESPYNTYKYPGLPPGPIANPSLDSIKAALDPATTDYLYYLTGFDGRFYYSTTLFGHEQNRRNHLNYND